MLLAAARRRVVALATAAFGRPHRPRPLDRLGDRRLERGVRSRDRRRGPAVHRGGGRAGRRFSAGPFANMDDWMRPAVTRGFWIAHGRGRRAAGDRADRRELCRAPLPTPGRSARAAAAAIHRAVRGDGTPGDAGQTKVTLCA